jgi:hypothetical protein
MLRSNRCRRRGISRMDVIVALGAAAFIASLLLTLIQHSREAGRRNRCFCHGLNISLSMINQVSTPGRAYPGYIESLKLVRPLKLDDGRVVEEARVSWVVSLLPFVERQDLFEHWRNGDAITRSGTLDDPIANGYLDLFVCPSNRSSPRFPPPCSYVVNAGRQDVPAVAASGDSLGWPADWPANGVFFNRFVGDDANREGAPLVRMTQDFIKDHDGTSYTLMMSERLDSGSYADLPRSSADAEAALGFVWWPATHSQPPFRPPLPSQRINGPTDRVPINNARPSSNHPGGVVVNFCDGHGRFMSDRIDYEVYSQLMTPDGSNCNDPGAVDRVPAGPTNNFDVLRRGTVDDAKMP